VGSIWQHALSTWITKWEGRVSAGAATLTNPRGQCSQFWDPYLRQHRLTFTNPRGSAFNFETPNYAHAVLSIQRPNSAEWKRDSFTVKHGPATEAVGVPVSPFWDPNRWRRKGGEGGRPPSVALCRRRHLRGEN